MLKVYAYKGCDTCRKALNWLRARGIAHEEIPIRELPPTVDELQRVLAFRGGALRLLFNTSGQDYRSGGWSEKLPAIDESAALSALAANGNLVKRPVVIDTKRGIALNGFKEAEWASALCSS